MKKPLEIMTSKLKLPSKASCHKERTPLKISNMAGSVVTSVTTISLETLQRIFDQIFTIYLHQYRQTLDIYDCGELTGEKQWRNGTTQMHILTDFNIHKHLNAHSATNF